MNILTMTDGYHMTMGYLIGDAGMEMETHILYARCGGPQVVPDLAEIVAEYLQWRPTEEDILEAEEYWTSQGVPVAVEFWWQIAAMSKLPITVRGVRDGEVVRPGEPMAVIRAPAVLAAVPEPVFIGQAMKAVQLATRFTKISKAVGWDRRRVFEVGMRAANSVTDHNESIAVLEKVGLGMSSSGVAAQQAGIAAGGSMGHRYTQRFANDYEAFMQAVDRMLMFKQERGNQGKVKLSLLLDTRSTLQSGLPAAIRVIEERFADIVRDIDLSVRLDSGDLVAQLLVIMRTFKERFEPRGWLPAIIVESGLTPEQIARFEQVAAEQGYPRDKMVYGVGGYLVGGLSRDFVSMVYKVSSVEGRPTMKFGDEEDAGKMSYPGEITLVERGRGQGVDRRIALLSEMESLGAAGWTDTFIDIARDGVMVAPAVTKEERVARIEERWDSVGRSYLGDEKYPRAFARRPGLSAGVKALARELSNTGTRSVTAA